MDNFELKNLPTKEVYPGYVARIIHSDNMIFAWFEIEPERPLPPHAHHHEQVVHVLAGELDLTIDGKTIKLLPGMVAVIPPNVPHTAIARIKGRTLDVFSPRRDDL